MNVMNAANGATENSLATVEADIRELVGEHTANQQATRQKNLANAIVTLQAQDAELISLREINNQLVLKLRERDAYVQFITDEARTYKLERDQYMVLVARLRTKLDAVHTASSQED